MMTQFLITICTFQRLYYSNAQELAKQASQIACKTCDELFITLLEQYIADKACEPWN
jgi:hypothetical protein